MRSSVVVISVLLGFSAQADEPSLEIAGVTITRGMPENQAREAFREIYCIPNAPNECSVGDGIPPEYDGDITFKDGKVHSAAKNLPIPEDQGDLLLLLYTSMEHIAGEGQSCARIQLHRSQEGWLKYVTIAWPDKAIWIQTQDPTEGRRFDMIKETLRPATASNATEAQDNQIQEC